MTRKASPEVSTYRSRPWLADYREGQPAAIERDHRAMLESFRTSCERAPGQVVFRYFDGELTSTQLDRASHALALALLDRNFQPGDRLAVYVQNNPGLVVGLLGAWKAGGAAVAINPRNKSRELAFLLADSGATALLCLDELHLEVACEIIASGQTDVRTVVTTSELDWQSRDDTRVLRSARRPAPVGVLDLMSLVSSHNGRPGPGAVPPGRGEVAVLTYSSVSERNRHQNRGHRC